MAKYLLALLFVAFSSVLMPNEAKAGVMIELVDNSEFDKVVISINGATLRIVNGSGLTMSIYNVAGGAPVMKQKIDSPDKRIDLNLPKGIYIVQVGKVVRKIVIK